MSPTRRDAIIGGLLFGGAAAAGAAGALVHGRTAPTQRQAFVAGDSLGVGIATAAGLPCVAVAGTHMRNVNAVAHQLLSTPPDCRVYLSLGMNDAIEHDVNFGVMHIKEMLKLAGQRELIWIGPPRPKNRALLRCVLDVDAALNRPLPGLALAGPTPRYISTLDFDIGPWSRDKLGVHFTSKGYAALWEFINHRVGS